MSNKDTQFSSDNQPNEKNRRGKSPKTKILEALRRSSKTEDDFWDALVMRALGPDDPIALREVLARLSPTKKATMPKIEFEFDANATPSIQASQILKAASDGIIPPDVAQVFITCIASTMKIEEVTEIADRLTAIEKELGLNG